MRQIRGVGDRECPFSAVVIAAGIALVGVVVVGLVPEPAAAVTIESRSASSPAAGVRIVEGRTSGPEGDFYAAYVDLCADYVHVGASDYGGLRSAGAWGSSVGAELAVNGDFFTLSGTNHVYGDAVGTSGRWPSARTGRDGSYSDGWYYQKYGWLAFGSGWADSTNSEWVKQNNDQFGAVEGYAPGRVTESLRSGTEALVSGFPQLVVEGEPIRCSSPTASSCFPDRSDMRERHPRTAMGLSRDRQTFMLVVVDGRSQRSAGMYGTELADLMHKLGAWTALNLDGGGSSQMWVDGRGTINRPSDGTPRGVMNHWGVPACAVGFLEARGGRRRVGSRRGRRRGHRCGDGGRGLADGRRRRRGRFRGGDCRFSVRRRGRRRSPGGRVRLRPGSSRRSSGRGAVCALRLAGRTVGIPSIASTGLSGAGRALTYDKLKGLRA